MTYTYIKVFNTGKELSLPLIEHYDEFYSEDEDEEIDLDKLERTNGQNEEVSEEKGEES